MYPRTIVFAVVLFKFMLKCHQYHVVVTINVSSMEAFSSVLINAQLESSSCENKINPVVYFVFRAYHVVLLKNLCGNSVFATVSL